MENQNPELLERLKSLEKQKEEVMARTDISSNDRSDAAKRLRREIRKVKERLGLREVGDRSTSTRSERPSEDQDETSEKSVRGSRIRSHQKHELTAEELAHYVEKIKNELMENGLPELEGGKIPINCVTQAYDMILCAERNISLLQIINKFKSRWNDFEPEWFTFTSNSMTKDGTLHFGPLPKGMTNEI